MSTSLWVHLGSIMLPSVEGPSASGARAVRARTCRGLPTTPEGPRRAWSARRASPVCPPSRRRPWNLERDAGARTRVPRVKADRGPPWPPRPTPLFLRSGTVAGVDRNEGPSCSPGSGGGGGGSTVWVGVPMEDLVALAPPPPSGFGCTGGGGGMTSMMREIC